MQKQQVLFDNTSFAGVVRCLKPELIESRKFIESYPEHKDIDILSFKQFLTAICLYDEILLQAASYEHEEKEETWVEYQLRQTPSELAEILNECPLQFGQNYEQETNRTIELAYDLFSSGLSENLKLKPTEKLPYVYTSGNYHYKDRFLKIHQKNGMMLSERNLAQAMFLHRGLFLQGVAKRNGIAYWPYSYRGRMLSELSPLIIDKAPSNGTATARLSGCRPSEDEYLKTLNQFYYKLLDEVRWYEFSDSIPFIGEAIYMGSKGNCLEALQMAFEIRRQGEIRNRWDQIRTAVNINDKAKYSNLLQSIQRDFVSAAAHLGFETENPNINTVIKLACSFLPNGTENAINSSIAILPNYMKEWGRHSANLLLSKNSFQSLFITHAKGLQG